ncbi:hypothetical protein OAD86_00695 [bacterium]|nr:hypothetical protein [bacterium]
MPWDLLSINQIGVMVFTSSLKMDCKQNLRHTHASNLLMNNFPLIKLSHRLGHADPHVTLKVYSHFVKGMEVQIEEYMEKLG